MIASNYFWNGFQHAVFGGGFALLFYVLTKTDYFRRSEYWIGVIMTSGALFFLPGHIGRYGSWLDNLYQFLHYPLSDWDILLLNIQWHRFFITHSLVIPTVMLVILLKKPAGYRLALGMCIGLSSHLVWDALTCSMRTPVVFLLHLFEIRGYWAKGWLTANGILLFGFAYFVHQKMYGNQSQKV